MTSVSVPDFILALFENEIVNVIHRTVDVLAAHSSVPKDELMIHLSKEFKSTVRLIPIDEEQLKITKVRPRKLVEDELRCTAEIMKQGIPQRCSFAKCKNSDSYCTRHMKKYQNSIEILSNKHPESNVMIVKKLRKLY
jgi:hypothetical protein